MIELSPNQIPEDLKKYFRPKRKYGSWIMRNLIVWHKPNCMPSSVKDRFTVDFETVGFFVKNKKYWFEQQYERYSEATLKDGRIVRIQAGIKLRHTRNKNYTENKVQEPSDIRDRGHASIDINRGRNKRCVWSITTKPFKEAHFATYPEKLIEPMIKAGCPVGGVVLDPFMGSGTTAVVALKYGRKYFGIELNPEYIKICNKRLAQGVLFQ